MFIEFIERLSKYPVKIVVVSAGGLPHCLPVFKHIEVQYKHKIWVKENLVNIAVKRLPSNWKYMAWIDADITFLNENWVSDSIDALQNHDIVQLFQTAVNLGPNQEAMKIDKSFAYMYSIGSPYCKSDKYGFWHPGYGWACTKKAYKQMGGLLDWAILGSGDRHMALAWIGKVEFSAPGNIDPNYKFLLQKYENSCKNLTISYIPGTILHHWHGSLVNRRYRERWEILTKGGYEPPLDVDYTNDGLIYLTQKGTRLASDIYMYFRDRKEDD